MVALVGGLVAMHGFAEMDMTGIPAAGTAVASASDRALQHGQAGSPAAVSVIKSASPALTSTCPMTHVACTVVRRGDESSAGAPADSVVSSPNTQLVHGKTLLTSADGTGPPPAQGPVRSEVSRT